MPTASYEEKVFSYVIDRLFILPSFSFPKAQTISSPAFAGQRARGAFCMAKPRKYKSLAVRLLVARLTKRNAVIHIVAQFRMIHPTLDVVRMQNAIGASTFAAPVTIPFFNEAAPPL